MTNISRRALMLAATAVVCPPPSGAFARKSYTRQVALWQDLARTIPVTAPGQPVAVWVVLDDLPEVVKKATQTPQLASQ